MSERCRVALRERGQMPVEGPTVERGRRHIVGGLLGLPLLVGAAMLTGCAADGSPPMRDMGGGSAAKRRNPRWGYRDHAR